MGARFGPDRRLHTRREFTRAYDQGTKRHGRFLTAFLLPNSRGVARLGLAVTRKFGGAVQRNLAKRRLREIFRQLGLERGVDVVLVPKRQFFEASYADIEADLRALVGARNQGWTADRRGDRPSRARGPDQRHSRL